MAWHPQPRRMRLDGADAVVLTPHDYERLDTIRRQAGAQAMRIHTLRQQLAAATQLLEEITRAIAQDSCTARADDSSVACMRQTIAAILGSSVTGGSEPRRRADTGDEPDRREERNRTS